MSVFKPYPVQVGLKESEMRTADRWDCFASGLLVSLSLTAHPKGSKPFLSLVSAVASLRWLLCHSLRPIGNDTLAIRFLHKEATRTFKGW